MKFRWHRGSYEESMATVQTFSSRAELEKIVGGPVTLKDYGLRRLDRRNGWDTWIVLNAEGDAVGMTDGSPDETDA